MPTKRECGVRWCGQTRHSLLASQIFTPNHPDGGDVASILPQMSATWPINDSKRALRVLVF